MPLADKDLEETFVDVGVIDQIDNGNHQVLFGRRGTGKSHLLRVLSKYARDRQDHHAIYLDLRLIGSARFVESTASSILDRTLSVFRDILDSVHGELVRISSDSPDGSLEACDRLHDAIHNATIEVQRRSVRASQDTSLTTDRGGGLTISLSAAPGLTADGRRTNIETTAHEYSYEEVARDSLVFQSVSYHLLSVLETMEIERLYVLLDEWSSIPLAVQPYLAEFLKRSVFPCRRVAIKIAALSFHSLFGAVPAEGRRQTIGLELGGDIAANIDLDDYYIYDKSPDFVTEVFIKIMYLHIQAGLPTGHLSLRHRIDGPAALRTRLFADGEAFTELVRAGEGVVRDFFGVLTKAYQTGRIRELARIDIPTIEEAAVNWYEDDKVRHLTGTPLVFLEQLTRHVVGDAESCYFLLDERDSENELVRLLVDHRVIHVMRRGYTDMSAVGKRFNIYALDYGTFVPYKRSLALQQTYMARLEGNEPFADAYCVPFGDNRGTRRVVVDLDEVIRGDLA
ncbi:MAG: hypothetical protein LC808_29390 [Actinobacteria bacterium]|nr:hypothetical protein [Actinomycetota bacterium]